MSKGKKSVRASQKDRPLLDREFSRLKKVVPRNKHQGQYLESITNNTITVGLGPAGSGKTYLATYMALLYHWSKEVKRLVITRPAVEAGEKLGFLPGTLDDKLDPYMRPIYDSLYDLIGIEAVRDKVDRGHIEIAPLAYMRGRTFNNCFIILDEAQNATIDQLKMVSTRLGENCKLVIDGDPDQSDLTNGKEASLRTLSTIFADVPDIGVVEFEEEDIVRHQIVMDVVRAFQRYSKEK